MAKKKVLYVELPAHLKKRFDRIAATNGRKQVAEAIRAIQRYVEQEEKHLKLPPLPVDPPDPEEAE